MSLLIRLSCSRLSFAAAIVGVGIATGCATKRYGRMQPLSAAEADQYDCRELIIEISKVEAFIKQVEDGAKVDGASVLGFLGDFGIGNSMEKNSAMRSANDRLEELRALQVSKGCL